MAYLSLIFHTASDSHQAVLQTPRFSLMPYKYRGASLYQALQVGRLEYAGILSID